MSIYNQKGISYGCSIFGKAGVRRHCRPLDNDFGIVDGMWFSNVDNARTGLDSGNNATDICGVLLSVHSKREETKK